MVDLIYEIQYNQTINKIIYVGLKLFLVVVFLISYKPVSKAQIVAGAKQVSISNSGAAISNDVFALFNNPAGLAQINWREIGVFYSPSPFGFKELANAFISYNEPFSFGSISLGGMTYGFELYKENKILLGYSHNFSNRFFLGVALNYHSVSIKRYGSKSVFYFNIGALAYIINELRWGFYINNINRSSFTKEEDQIPTIYNTGLGYNLIPELALTFALEKDVRYPASLKLGIDYYIIENISLRFGFSNEPSAYSAGIGINYSFISLDYAVYNHPDLGLTHQAGLIFSFEMIGNRYEKIRKSLKQDHD